ncbi:MAG: NAD(P)H-dependent oxidoreductase subunit E [Elusimicrobia bacterium]|nr:NAD(P)H-dependent oxidoreductase subunit E [Elusimicrobiota bacterium]
MTTDTLELEKIRLDVDKICQPWKDRPGNLIMVLHAVQKYSYVPGACRLRSPKPRHSLARIYEVITFFNYFKLEPPGKNVVSVCMGTACYLWAGALVQELYQALGIRPGETTPDKTSICRRSAALGCCGQAPVPTVGGKGTAGWRPARSRNCPSTRRRAPNDDTRRTAEDQARDFVKNGKSDRHDL